MSHPLKYRQHWVFDMDGTLTHSAHDFEFIRKELGLEPAAPILEALNAMPQIEAAPLWEKLDDLELHFADKSTVMTGAKALLNCLRDNNITLGILTRNTMPVVDQTLKACNLTEFFNPDHILDRDSCTPKPSPEGIQYLINTWGAEIDDCVMVGDYVFDLQAGKNAGVSTVHVDIDGEIDWPELTDFKVRELKEIESWFSE